MAATPESTADRIRRDLHDLVVLGLELYYSLDEQAREKVNEKLKTKLEERHFASEYQEWYSRALEVVRNLLPNRAGDFKELYAPSKRREMDLQSYSIADYIHGYELVQHPGSHKSVAAAKFYQQQQILQACEKKLDSALLNIRELLHADLLRGELDEAEELQKKKFLRAGGAVTGVALERHLRLVAESHNIPVKKTDPGINDLNELLRQADVYDMVTWRFIGHLADIRNLCDHDKKREPTSDEIAELIQGVRKVMGTVS
jgi:hypothetical protein